MLTWLVEDVVMPSPWPSNEQIQAAATVSQSQVQNGRNGPLRAKGHGKFRGCAPRGNSRRKLPARNRQTECIAKISSLLLAGCQRLPKFALFRPNAPHCLPLRVGSEKAINAFIYAAFMGFCGWWVGRDSNPRPTA